MLTRRDRVTLMGIRVFPVMTPLVIYVGRGVSSDLETLCFVLMFRLTGDGGNWRSLRGIFFSFLLTSHRFCSVRFCRDQYPPQLTWVCAEVRAADDRWRFGCYFEPTMPGKFLLIFRQWAEYRAGNSNERSRASLQATLLWI